MAYARVMVALSWFDAIAIVAIWSADEKSSLRRAARAYSWHHTDEEPTMNTELDPFADDAPATVAPITFYASEDDYLLATHATEIAEADERDALFSLLV